MQLIYVHKDTYLSLTKSFSDIYWIQGVFYSSFLWRWAIIRMVGHIHEHTHRFQKDFLLYDQGSKMRIVLLFLWNILTGINAGKMELKST